MSSLLPINATPQELALEGAVSRLDQVPVVIRELWDPATCPANLLPWLAWALSVEEWDSDWAESIKRNVLARTMELHRHKGTPWAVEQAVVVAGSPNAKIEEWFDYAGLPYHFKVLVDVFGDTVTIDTEQRMRRTIDKYKNVRSVMDALEFNYSVQSPLYLGVGLQSSEVITVYPKPAA